MSYVDPRSLVCVEQILTILDYMKDNPQLAHGRFSRTKESRSLVQRHWAACADLANNVTSECIQKTPEQWRAYYSAYKSKLMKKIRDIKTEMMATGAPAKKRLTQVENKLFSILGPDLGEQYPRVCSTPSRLEVEHQPSSSTAEFLPQEDTNVTIGSDSSEIMLYYPEDDAEPLSANPVKTDQLIADTLDHIDQQLEPMGYTGQELGPLAHKSQQSEPVDYTKQQRGPVVYKSQQINPVHTNKELSVGYRSQDLGSVDNNTTQHFGPANITDQQQRPDFHKLEPAAQVDQKSPVIGRGPPKNESENAASQPPQFGTSTEKDNGSVPIHEATEVLLTIERMKAETKREATAAINRLAGALEAIAEQIGGLKKLQSPPPAKKRCSRISSSESN